MSKNFVKIGDCIAVRATSEKLHPSDIGQMFVPKRDDNGNIIINEFGDTYGRILYQQKLVFWDGSFRKSITRNLFIVDTAKNFSEMPIEEGEIAEGKVLIRELSYEPFGISAKYDGTNQRPVMNPQTEQPVLHNGRPFYSNIKTDPLVKDIDDLNMVDSLFVGTIEYNNAYAVLAKKYGRVATIKEVTTSTTVKHVDNNELFDEGAVLEQKIPTEGV